MLCEINETPDTVIINFSLKTSSFTAIHLEEVYICWIEYQNKPDIPLCQDVNQSIQWLF